MKLERGRLGGHAASPSLDRVDNSLGYIKGNVIIVSMKANAIKNSATVLELEQVARYYKSLGAK